MGVRGFQGFVAPIESWTQRLKPFVSNTKMLPLTNLEWGSGIEGIEIPIVAETKN